MRKEEIMMQKIISSQFINISISYILNKQKLINFWLTGGTVGTRTDKENEEKNVKMKRVSILLKAIAKQKVYSVQYTVYSYLLVGVLCGFILCRFYVLFIDFLVH